MSIDYLTESNISQVRRLKLVQLPRLQLYTKHMIIRDIAKLQLLIYPIWMFFACCFPSWFFFMSFVPLYCTEDTRLQAVFSPALSDYLAMDPTRLLPITQYPVWNGGKGRWVIPGSWPHFRYALFCTPSKNHFLHFWAIWLFLNKSHQSRPHQSEVCDGSDFNLYLYVWISVCKLLANYYVYVRNMYRMVWDGSGWPGCRQNMS